MQKVRPKKALGQHFLTDKNISKKIVDALSPTEEGSIIEVGPGTGALSQYLVNTNKFYIAFEVDSESVEFLKNNYPDTDFVKHEDFLKARLDEFPKPYFIIGNLPYNISSQIFFKILDLKDDVTEVVCMIQKEVADRIASPPGNKTYGILSVLLQTWFDIEYLFTVHENCFNPPPNVKSAVIKLKRNQRTELKCNQQFYKKIIKQAFNQRRKTLRNSLKNICLNLDGSTYPFNKRPEQLSIEEFIELTYTIEKLLSNVEQQ